MGPPGSWLGPQIITTSVPGSVESWREHAPGGYPLGSTIFRGGGAGVLVVVWGWLIGAAVSSWPVKASQASTAATRTPAAAPPRINQRLD